MANHSMDDIEVRELAEATFRRIHLLRRWLYGVLFTYMPTVVICWLLKLPDSFIMVVCLAWFCTGTAIALRLGFVLCPLCRQYFHVRGLEGSAFAKACVNCGIRLNDPTSPFRRPRPSGFHR